MKILVIEWIDDVVNIYDAEGNHIGDGYSIEEAISSIEI